MELGLTFPVAPTSFLNPETPLSPPDESNTPTLPLRRTITFAAYVTLNDGRRDLCNLTPNRMPRTTINHHPTINRHRPAKRVIIDIWEVDIATCNSKALRAYLASPEFHSKGFKYRTYAGGEFVFEPDTSLPGRSPIPSSGYPDFPAPIGGFDTKLIEERMVHYTEATLMKMRVFYDLHRMIGTIEEDLEYLEAMKSGEAFSSDEDIADISLRIHKNTKKCNKLLQIPPKYTIESTDKTLDEIKELGWRYINSESIRRYLMDAEKMFRGRLSDMVPVDTCETLALNES